MPFKRRLLVLFGLLVVVSGSSHALAKDARTVSLLGANLVLPIPKGYCPLSAAHPADKDLMSRTERTVGTRNRVLLMFADCAQLKRYRSTGTAMSNSGSYMAPKSARKPVRMPRSKFARVIGAQIKKQTGAIKKAQRKMTERINKEGNGAELKGNKNLGLVRQDDTAAFMGLVQTWQAEGSSKILAGSVTGLTLVRERIVSLNLYAPYEGRKTIESLLKAQRANIKRLIEAN